MRFIKMRKWEKISKELDTLKVEGNFQHSLKEMIFIYQISDCFS